MSELTWLPITRDDAIDRLKPCYRNPSVLLDELEHAAFCAPGDFAPVVRTPYRLIRWNGETLTFETALVP